MPNPRPQLQDQSLPLPQFTRVISTPKKDLSLWKLSREFDDTTDAYQQPPQEVQLYQQELQGRPAPTELTYQYPRGEPASSMAAQQRETVPIGYDPSYGSAQAGMAAAGPGTQSSSQGMPLPGSGPTENSPRGFPPYQYGGGAQVVPPPPPAPAELPSTTTEESGYSPDWITAEAPNTITDGDFYDQDADSSGGDGMYTYGAPQQQQQQPLEPPAGGYYAPQPPSSGNDAVSEARESQEFEQPRQVPYDHRQTRVVLKEDLDFYMALLGGQEPAPASSGTQTLLQQEQEVRRRSQELEAQQLTLRRQEELQDAQGDLDFWASLMQK